MASPNNSGRLSLEKLRALLRYEPDTGKFIWIVSPRIGVPVGTEAGSYSAGGYRQIGIRGRSYLGHRLAWYFSHGVWPPEEIDHIDRDKKNNRLANLRLASRQINVQNVPVLSGANATERRGVSRYKGRYYAKIKLRGKQYALGGFATPEEASGAYVEAKRLLHEGSAL